MIDLFAIWVSFSKRAIKLFPPFTWVEWLLFFMPLTVALAFILSVGPEVQSSIFAVLSSDVSDIYGATYEDAIVVRFPSLADWLSFAFHWHFIVLAVTILLLALRGSSLKSFLLLAAFWAALILTLSDFIDAALRGKFEVSSQVVNVVANIAGGPVIGVLLGSALVLASVAKASLKSNHTLGLVVSATILVSFCALVSGGVYFGLRVFYQPLATNVVMVADPPVTGFYWSEPDFKDGETKTRPATRFNFLPTDRVFGGANISGYGGPLRAVWQRVQKDSNYDVEVRLLGDCSLADLRDLTLSPTLLAKRNANEVSVTLDQGLSVVKVQPGRNRIFELKDRAPTFYWIKRDQRGGGLKVDYFIVEEDSFKVSSSEELTFLIGAPLFGRSGEAFSLVDRTISIKVDDVIWRHTFSRAEPLRKDHRSTCQSLEFSENGNAKAPIYTSSTEVAVLVTLTPKEEKALFHIDPEAALTFQGVEGWLSVTDLPVDGLRDRSQGYLSAISIRGPISEFSIDGSAAKLEPHNAVVMFGYFAADYIDGGRLKVSGKARILRRDSTRLNATKWEKLPTEWQLALLTAAWTLLSVVLASLWRPFRALSSKDVKNFVAWEKA